MTSSFSLALVVLAAGALHADLRADTIVVDDDFPGPGIDFPDIPPAIAAASSGDLILVHSGTYSGFVFDKGLTLLGLDAAGPIHVAGGVTVAGNVPFRRGVLSTFECSSLTIRDCPGSVILDDVRVGGSAPTVIRSCADVRLRRTTILGGLASNAVEVDDSRVEFVQARIEASGGWCCDISSWPCPQQTTCLLASSSTIRFALSTAIGGEGLPGPVFCATDIGGNGADGLTVHGTDLVLTGPGLIEGGAPGMNYGGCGTPVVLRDGSSLRASGVALAPGQHYPGNPPCEPVDSCADCTVVFPVPAAPGLEVDGAPVPGSPMHLRLHAPAGAPALLILGRRAVVQPLPGVGELLVSADATIALGSVPPTGLLEADFDVPASLPTGHVFFAQALVVQATGERRLTNSVPLVVR